MLSSHEMGYLKALTRKNTPEAFLEEQALRSRAAPTQQLRVYGYWTRGKAYKAKMEVSQCEDTHREEYCWRCGSSWGIHQGHTCPYGTMGVFRGCDTRGGRFVL